MQSPKQQLIAHIRDAAKREVGEDMRMSDGIFLQYLIHHPQLLALLYVALREGTVTDALVNKYYVSETLEKYENRKERKGTIFSFMSDLNIFVSWIVEAGRRFHFQIFGKRAVKPMIVKIGKFKPRSRLAEANASLIRKQEGGLVAFIQERRMRETPMHYDEISRELKDKTGVLVDGGHLFQIADRYKVTGNSPRRIKSRKSRKRHSRRRSGFVKGSNLYKADQKLKADGKGGLVSFIAEQRGGKKPMTYPAITEALKKATGLLIHNGNLCVIAHRYRVTRGKR